MKSANRFTDWYLFDRALREKRGTLIGECFSAEGPTRYWWADDDIAAVSPHAWADKSIDIIFSEDYDDFSSWCTEQYLETGKALLVSSSYVPELPKPMADEQTCFALPVVAMRNAKAFRLDRRTPAC